MNFKYFQPLNLLDKVRIKVCNEREEINTFDGYIIGISLVGTKFKHYRITVFVEELEKTNPTIVLDLVKTDKAIFIDRTFNNLSDGVCRYSCPIKNLADKETCSYCQFKSIISPSKYFFIGDEVRGFCKRNDELICGDNYQVEGIYFDYKFFNDINIYRTYKREMYYDPYLKEFHNIIKNKNVELFLKYVSWEVRSINHPHFSTLKSKELLRLRNRRGFLLDYDNKFCNQCILNNCENCEYNNFRNKLIDYNLVNNSLKLWKDQI